MHQFSGVLGALENGRKVRFNTWEDSTRMYVKDAKLVCQRGDGQPYSYDLSWHELTARGWQVV